MNTEVKLISPGAAGEPLAPAQWIAQLASRYAQSDRDRIARTLAEAGDAPPDTLATGESALSHAMATAALVADLGLDADSVIAALLAAIPPPAESARAKFRERHGADSAAIVEGVARMAQIDQLGADSDRQPDKAAQLEGLRKMLLAMVQDVRVVLVKLAAHTQSLRWLVKNGAPEVRARHAQLGLDIFAPLANRLGIWQLKWELEDLALRALEPETYKRIARMLDEKRVEREQFIAESIVALRAALEAAGLAVEITGRPKHIHSIWKKMQRKGVEFQEVYDVSALRVFVADVKDCYAALGVVHSLWTPIPKEFDDYIAKPKGNDYRSLHTAVAGIGGRVLEVQIRTHEMHRQAELGIAAHWRYKEGTRRDQGYDQKVSWLRQVLEWKDELADARELAEHFKSRLFEDTVYVLTPQGRVVDLPRGATPVDFAYALHTDVGHRCRGARVDGAIVPLNTVLANGQVVEVVTAKQGGPSRDWLNPALGFTVSHRARSKVRHWFNAQNLQEAVAQGRAVVEKELQRAGLTAMKLETLAGHFGFAKADDLFAEVGRGALTPRQVQEALRGTHEAPVEPAEPAIQLHKARAAPTGSGILVVGVDKLLTVPAKCCKPVPPDAIVGFVTRGRGVTIHRANCVNVSGMPAERLIRADWGTQDGASFAVAIEVEATDRTGLLRDVSDVFSRERINVTGVNTQTRDLTARMSFTVEVADAGQVKRVLAEIGKVAGVTRAARR